MINIVSSYIVDRHKFIILRVCAKMPGGKLDGGNNGKGINGSVILLWYSLPLSVTLYRYRDFCVSQGILPYSMTAASSSRILKATKYRYCPFNYNLRSSN